MAPEKLFSKRKVVFPPSFFRGYVKLRACAIWVAVGVWFVVSFGVLWTYVWVCFAYCAIKCLQMFVQTLDVIIMYVVWIVRHLKVLLISFGMSILRLFWRCFLTNKMGCLTQGGNQWDSHNINYCRSVSINSSTVFSQGLRFSYPVTPVTAWWITSYSPWTLSMFSVLDHHFCEYTNDFPWWSISLQSGFSGTHQFQWPREPRVPPPRPPPPQEIWPY